MTHPNITTAPLSNVAHLFQISILFAALSFWACGGDDPKPTPPCQTNADCPNGVCDANGVCVAGECLDDEDCGEDYKKRCDTAQRVCVFRDGFADECSSDRLEACTFGQFCSTLLGRCLDADAATDCVRRSQCPAGQICDHAAGQCIADPGCYTDAFCEPGEVCDLVAHQCRPYVLECTPCQEGCTAPATCDAESNACRDPALEPACQTNETCDPLGRCVQCFTTADCGPGLICNPGTGDCESNVQCVDDPSACPNVPDIQCVICQEPQVCNPRTRRCQAPPRICESDIDCTENNEICDTSIDPPQCVSLFPDCLNDLLDEPRNDRAETATALNLPGEYDELKICPGDQDWYRLNIPSGTYLSIDARFSHTEGDLELQLFLADGQSLIDESRSVTDNERVEIEAGTDLVVLLRVFRAVPSVRAVSYKLLLNTQPAALCADESSEPNDSPQQATALTNDLAFDGRICAADPDWFLLRNVPAGSRISLELNFTHTRGDLDLELYRLGANTPLLAARTLQNNEYLEHDASYGGDFFVRVLGKGADTNVYTLIARIRDNPLAACLDDSLEINNDREHASPATELSQDPAPTLNLCAGDRDWYALDLQPGHAITAEMEFAAGRDLDLQLYENNEPVAIRASDLTTTREFVGYRSFNGGRYYVEVFGHRPQDIGEYSLNIATHASNFCDADEFDLINEGNSQATAADLGTAPLHRNDLSICGFDTDWYQVILRAGYRSTVQIHHIANEAVLDVALVDNAGQVLIANGQQMITGGGDDAKALSMDVRGSSGGEMVYVVVFASVGFETNYSLHIDEQALLPCADDAEETNDTLENASSALVSMSNPVQVENLRLCASLRDLNDVGDTDWFVVEPPAAGAVIRADVQFTGGDLFLELLSPGGLVRACPNVGELRCYSDGGDNSEHIVFTATTTEPYYLRVGSVYSAPGFPRPTDPNSEYVLNLEFSSSP